MIKKISFYIFLLFCLILNIVVDLNIKNYFEILKKCFGQDIVLNTKLYTFICVIIALISIFVMLDILLVTYKKNDENNGIKFKVKDGTHGTANWMSESEMTEVLSFDKPGIILGKYNSNLVKLPFDSYFNKNISVFGSSRKYEDNSVFCLQICLNFHYIKNHS